MHGPKLSCDCSCCCLCLLPSPWRSSLQIFTTLHHGGEEKANQCHSTVSYLRFAYFGLPSPGRSHNLQLSDLKKSRLQSQYRQYGVGLWVLNKQSSTAS